MRKLLILFIPIFIACTKDQEEKKYCNYDDILSSGFDWENNGNVPLPLSSQNFWTYSDSVFIDGNIESVGSALNQIDRVYIFQENFVLGFSTLLPMMYAKNDTLFSVEFTPEQFSPECFKVHEPILFSTKDTVQISAENKLFYSNEEIKTGAGTFTGNLVYQVSDFYEIIFNENVGALKISLFVRNSNGENMKRRVLTLKDYSIY